jgi:cyclohexanecarboxyl-CoA dehydrogenase
MLTFGHVGYSAEHPAQLLYRDAIGYEIGEGPENIQKILLSRLAFGKTPS